MPYTYTDCDNITDTSNTWRGCDPAVSKDALITRYSNVVDYCVYDDNCVDDGSDDYYYYLRYNGVWITNYIKYIRLP